MQWLVRREGLRAAASTVVCGSLLIASPAFAQTDSATARGLFSEGRKLMAAKKYDQACPKFEESQRLDPGIGAMFNLADCWDQSGRTASAWAMFLDTAAAARAAGQADRERVAKERAAAIEGKVSHLTVHVTDSTPNLEVKRDGEVLRAASYGVPVPVDRGSHHLEVSAPGKKSYAVDLNVAAAAAVTAEIPKLEDAEPVSATAPQRAAPESSSSASNAQAAPAAGGARSHGSKVLPYSLLGLGVVGVAVAAVFELKSRSANSDALGLCSGNGPCTSTDVTHHASLVSDAETDRTGAIVGLGVGALSLASGIILFATDHAVQEKPSASAWHVHFGASVHGAAAIAEGQF